MLKKLIISLLSVIFLISCNPVYTKEIPSKSIIKYISRISNKFSRTYCNAINFGISNEGALSFAIGETNKEFKNNNLNNLIDYSLLKKDIVNSLDNNCQVYDFPLSSLDKLKFNKK